MNSTNDLLKRIALGLLGLSLMAYGLWPRNEESTATRTRTRNAASVGSGAKAITPPLVKIPIKDMRVGTRVPAFNPEVSATERSGFREPNWYQWMKLRLEMPKPDGTLLEIEMLRSEEWLVQHMAVVVQPESIMLPAYSEAELNATNASAVSEPSSLGSPAIAAAKNAAATEATVTETTVTESRSSESRSSEARSSEARSSEARSPESRSSEARSSESRSSESRSSEATRSDGFDVPLRPVYFHLTSLLDEVAAGGNEVLGLVVQLDLPELGLSGPAWIVDLEPAPITPPGPGQVVTATFKHASANVLDLVLTSTPPPSQTTALSTQLSSYSEINTSPSVPIASPSNLIASPSALSDPPTESIGVTANHPFWSVDRAEFVQAGELTIGERLQTLAGDTVWVQQKLPRPGPEPVYNLEVHDEHVYYVGTSGTLAHNAGKKYIGDLGEDGAKGWLARHGYTEVRSIQNPSGHGLDIIARHRDGTLTIFEVKTSSLSRVAGLSAAQRNFFNFITSRLKNAATKAAWWRKTPQSVADDADQLYNFVNYGGKFRRYVIEITGAGNPNLPTQFRILPWLQ